MKKALLMLALVAGFTCFAQNAQAALIPINIGPTGFNIGGINGGGDLDDIKRVRDFPFAPNSFDILNNFLPELGGYHGLTGAIGIFWAAGTNRATPVNFALNASIGASIGDSNTYVNSDRSYFQAESDVSPDFGPQSYMGFKTTQGNYGWLEVTWTNSTGEFQILSGAYESTPDVAIPAGAGGAAPIPEPGTWAAMAIFAGGAAFAGWRRRNSAKVAA